MKSRNLTIASIFLMLLLVTNFQLTSQEIEKEKIDSALNTLSSKTDLDKEKVYQYICNLAFRGGNESIPLFDYALSKDSSDLSKMIIYRKYGQKLSQKGQLDDAIKYYQEGLVFAQKRNAERSIMDYYGALGNGYQYLNKVDSALAYLNKGQTLAEKPENKDYLWYFYYQKGIIRNHQGDIAGNTDYYEKMYEASTSFGNTPTARFVLYILVQYYSQLDEPEKLAFYTETLANYYEEANPNTPQGHMPIKDIFKNFSNPENLSKFKNAIRVSDSLNNINSLSYSTIALADIYEKMGEPQLALPYLNQTLDKLNQVNKPQVKLDVLTKMYTIQSLANNYQKAFEYKILEDQLRDSITSEKMQRNIAELEVKFDTEKKERKILEQDLVIEKETRQKNQILLGAIAIGILLLAGLLFVRNRLKYQKTIAAQTEAIQKQQIKELEQQNKLLALNSMIEGQEAERLRIAKDLHDSLGGLLSTVKAHFTTIQNEIAQLEQLNITEKTNNLIDEACIEVRRISHNMMPHALSISGLEGALEDMADNLQEEGLQTALEINNLPESLDTTKEVMIFRLVQEIISNIRKHAAAKLVLIQILGHQNSLNIIIEDDGKGFDYQKAQEKGGLGLKSIDSRVNYLDGTIDWDTQPGRGTTITINIPRA